MSCLFTKCPALRCGECRFLRKRMVMQNFRKIHGFRNLDYILLANPSRSVDLFSKDRRKDNGLATSRIYHFSTLTFYILAHYQHQLSNNAFVLNGFLCVSFRRTNCLVLLSENEHTRKTMKRTSQ